MSQTCVELFKAGEVLEVRWKPHIFSVCDLQIQNLVTWTEEEILGRKSGEFHGYGQLESQPAEASHIPKTFQ